MLKMIYGEGSRTRCLPRPRTKMMLVNNVAVEEVQNTMGVIHFGHHFKGKTTIAIWRSCAGKLLSGEFAFQCKFDRIDEVSKESLELSEEFYKRVQLDCAEWIKLAPPRPRWCMGSAIVSN